MAYENKIAIESCVREVHEQQGTTEKAQQIIDELELAYRKAKAFDEICHFVSIKLDENSNYYFKSERDNGKINAYENIDDIIREHMERVDDER